MFEPAKYNMVFCDKGRLRKLIYREKNKCQNLNLKNCSNHVHVNE